MATQRIESQTPPARAGRSKPPVVDGGNGSPAVAEPSVASREQLLSEVSHELGNFFHKLYYWAEYLRDREPEKDGDPTAGEMLEGTIRRLQDFLKIAFEYFAPTQLNLTRMTAEDVLKSLVGKLAARLCGTQSDVSRPEVLGPLDVFVDPARMSYALDIVVRHIACQVGDASRIEVAIGTGTGDGHHGLDVRVAVKHPIGESPFFRSSEAGVEWALAEKLFQLHGGNLAQHVGQGDERGFGIFLPASG